MCVCTYASVYMLSLGQFVVSQFVQLVAKLVTIVARIRSQFELLFLGLLDFSALVSSSSSSSHQVQSLLTLDSDSE